MLARCRDGMMAQGDDTELSAVEKSKSTGCVVGGCGLVLARQGWLGLDGVFDIIDSLCLGWS
jgi:hypothetical protein